MEDFENSYIVFDVEATIRCPIGTNKANPHWKGNHIVLASVKTNTEPARTGWVSSEPDANRLIGEWLQLHMRGKKIVVGQNLPFDIQWLWRASDRKVDFSETTLWDIGLAEYVLTGQESKFPSLDEMSVKYGLPVKDKRIKEFWDAGVDTNDIPYTLLKPYCEQDVSNTEIIFLRQLKLAKAMGCLQLILVLNDALLAITEMMWNGMCVDVAELERHIHNYGVERKHIEKKFKENVLLEYGLPDINMGSPQQLSALLYGGEITYTTKEADGVFKTGPRKGEVKLKTVEHVIKFPGVVNAEDFSIEKITYGYSTSDDSLEKISKTKYVDEIRHFRTVDKQLTTYFEKTKNLLFGNIIYHNINSTATHTGRYSSSEPNLQNVTADEDSDIKKCYISRYGDKGVIVEIDFVQLEIVGLAQLSKDKDLIADISSGVDIHTKLFEMVYGYLPSKSERRDFKRAVFALLYGAGYTKIAKLTGMDIRDAKAFIYAWEKAYPDTVRFWTSLMNHVTENRCSSDRRCPITGIPLGYARYQLPTGRMLTFYEHVAPWNIKLKKATFSPNETRNYPIQSFATGDIVPLFLGRLYRRLARRSEMEIWKRVHLVNTVHDSVELDVHREALPELLKVLKNESDNMSEYMQKYFGIAMELPLRTKVSYGSNWCEQTEVEGD